MVCKNTTCEALFSHDKSIQLAPCQEVLEAADYDGLHGSGVGCPLWGQEEGIQKLHDHSVLPGQPCYVSSASPELAKEKKKRLGKNRNKM
jgi:hypothetical protein